MEDLNFKDDAYYSINPSLDYEEQLNQINDLIKTFHGYRKNKNINKKLIKLKLQKKKMIKDYNNYLLEYKQNNNIIKDNYTLDW